MLSTSIIVSAGLFLFLLFFLIGMDWFRRAQVQKELLSIQEGLKNLHQTLVFHQIELGKTEQVRTSELRLGLQQEIYQARQEFQTNLLQNGEGLEKKIQGMDEKIQGKLREMQEGLQTRLELNTKEGFVQYEKVQHYLKQAEIQLQNLSVMGGAIQQLSDVLKMPHLRGGFGEATLERILADFLPMGSYELQYQITPNSMERVDAIVRYAQVVLPIDSKFPREQILSLFETTQTSELEKARKELLEVVKIQAKSIREKYIRPEYGTTDLALLFVPSETLYFELLRNPKAISELGKNKVFIVSPNTLAITLHSISIAREYYEMAKGVEKTINQLKKIHQHFQHFEGRFNEVGSALNRAQTAFGTATTHLQRYSNAVNKLEGEQEFWTETLSSKEMTTDVSHPL